MIPGWACSTEVFRWNIPALAEHYRVIAYDPRSQGRSSQSENGNGYAQRGDDLHQLLELLNLSEVTLLGWSLGVYDLLSYVRQYGLDRVRSVVLVDESPRIIKNGAEDWGEGGAEEIASLIEMVNGPGYLPFFREYLAAGFEGDAPQSLLNRMAESAAALPPERAAARLEDATRHDFTTVSSKVAQQIPVMQILRQDWADDATRWIHANQPTARIEVLGGHMMLVEYAEAFNRVVLSFLDGN